jgi:hypothetical protein
MIYGFDDLTIVGAPGAMVTTTATGLESAPISVFASRTVAIEDLTIDAADAECGILLHRCQDCSVGRTELRNGGVGIHVSRMSWASLSEVTISGAGIGIVSVDTAMTELDHAILDGPGFAGLYAGKQGQIMFESTAIRDYWVGVIAATGGVVDFQRYPPRGGDRTIRIENNSTGVWASENSTIAMGGAAVAISDSTTEAIGAANVSTVSVGVSASVTVDGNAHDISCDSLSAIIGSANISGLDPARVSCPNLH